MARTNNLTNFLTDVSAAIKQKIGDNTPIPAANFDTEILSIETAGTYQDKTLSITTNGNYRLEPDQNFDAMSSVSITVNVPTGEDLDAVITAQEQKLTQLETILQSKASSGSVEPNIFVQDTEPTTKDGIWLKMSDADVEHYSYESEVFESEGWSQNTYAPISYEFSNGAIAKVGNFIYLFGSSYSGPSNNYPNLRMAYKFDILNDTYTRITDIPVDIAHTEAVAYGTDIYIIGNAESNNKNTNYKYDTINNTYTKMANTPVELFYAGTCIVNDKIYIFGGTLSSRTLYRYNILTDTYTQLTDIPYDFKEGECVNVGDYIYLFGSSSSGNENKAYKYNILNDTYTQLTNIPYNFRNGAVTVIGTDIYLIGSSFSNQTKFYKYDTLTDTYTQLTNVPNNGVYYERAITVGTDIYVFGGISTYTQRLVYSLASKIYLDNTVVINQGKYQSGSHDIVLYNNSKDITPAKYPLKDAYFYTTQNGLDGSMPVYYGDGTQWINIKNPPSNIEEVEEVEE